MSGSDEIIPLISEMPVLTKLTIEDVGRFGRPAYLWNIPQVTMECLETLELIDIHADAAYCLIEAISAPRLCRLVLHLRTAWGVTIDPWLRAASKYHTLRYLSIFAIPRDLSPIIMRWFERLNELEHLDISLLCQARTSEGAYTALRNLNHDVCPSLIRLQVSEDCDPATRELLRDVVRSRSGRGTSGFAVVVSNGDGYKELIL